MNIVYFRWYKQERGGEIIEACTNCFKYHGNKIYFYFRIDENKDR